MALPRWGVARARLGAPPSSDPPPALEGRRERCSEAEIQEGR